MASPLDFSYDDVTEIPRVPSIEYNDFFENHLSKNRPLLIGPELTRAWRSRKEWITPEGTPRLTFLKDAFGDSLVQVADCSQRNFNDQRREVIPFRDYIAYWEAHHRGEDQRIMYCKDWHIAKDYPDSHVYETPLIFQDDWLNSFWDAKASSQPAGEGAEAEPAPKKDDYRFCYLGPKGTWTPFHVDVYRSYSWSTNVCGKKRWTLFPPGQLELLSDAQGELVFDLRNTDEARFPRLKETRRLEVIQNAGETIFVPSCWYHQVENLEDTVSINHNWGNSCNTLFMWNLVKEDLRDVRKALSFCQEMEGWEGQCQLVLRANSGIDLHEFLQYLGHGLQRLKESPPSKLPRADLLLTSLSHLQIIAAELQQDRFMQEAQARAIREEARLFAGRVTEFQEEVKKGAVH